MWPRTHKSLPRRRRLATRHRARRPTPRPRLPPARDRASPSSTRDTRARSPASTDRSGIRGRTAASTRLLGLCERAIASASERVSASKRASERTSFSLDCVLDHADGEQNSPARSPRSPHVPQAHKPQSHRARGPDGPPLSQWYRLAVLIEAYQRYRDQLRAYHPPIHLLQCSYSLFVCLSLLLSLTQSQSQPLHWRANENCVSRI